MAGMFPKKYVAVQKKTSTKGTIIEFLLGLLVLPVLIDIVATFIVNFITQAFGTLLLESTQTVSLMPLIIAIAIKLVILFALFYTRKTLATGYLAGLVINYGLHFSLTQYIAPSYARF